MVSKVKEKETGNVFLNWIKYLLPEHCTKITKKRDSNILYAHVKSVGLYLWWKTYVVAFWL